MNSSFLRQSAVRYSRMKIENMYSVVTTAINFGLKSLAVRVETDVSDGLPVFDMVGFLGAEVREAKDRVRTALKNSGFTLAAKRITVNLTPADIRKSGNGCDLPVAVSLLTAFGYLDASLLADYMVIGEVGLNGDILPVHGVLSAVVLAADMHLKGIIIPWDNAQEAAVFPELSVLPVKSIRQLAEICQSEKLQESFYHGGKHSWIPEYDVDFSEVHGQQMVRRACEIAVSGMHNLLIIGPPGAGKTMIARRIPTILPELSQQEKLEISQIYSLSGLLDQSHIIRSERPFRSPHHTITPQAMAGGGISPRPGEISLAHHGVLFLDEFPEFKKNTLEVLREPMEDGQIHISRMGGSFVYPADFMLVAAMNPCVCGYYPNMNRCSCSARSIQNYIGRISQALLNRIDLCVEAQELSYQEMQQASCGESSADIRKRVVRTHALQRQRFAGLSYQYNSQIPSRDLARFCSLDTQSEEKMTEKYEEYGLSARSYSKVLRTARTIADMEQCEQIAWEHLEEALLYRGLDKKYWRRY